MLTRKKRQCYKYYNGVPNSKMSGVKTFTLFTVYFKHTIPSDYICSVRIHKITGPNPGPSSRRLEMSLCQPSSGWLPILFWFIGKNEAAKREKLAPYFICFVQDTLGLCPPSPSPHPLPPRATRLRGSLDLYLSRRRYNSRFRYTELFNTTLPIFI